MQAPYDREHGQVPGEGGAAPTPPPPPPPRGPRPPNTNDL
jgi:hypothetical protein